MGGMIAVKKEGDRVEDGGVERTRGGSCFRCLMKGSVIRLLGNRASVRLRFE